jgi:predicted Zn finger-like uncharacterized protein
MFKVVADQLRISEGWVRCGQCNEIFDASSQLQESAPPPPKARARKSSRPDLEVDAMPVGPSLIQVAESSFAPTAGPALDDAPDSETGSGFAPTEGLLAAQEIALPPKPKSKPKAPAPSVAPAPVGLEPSFMRRVKPASSWHRPANRAALFLLSLMLLAILLFQWTIQERDRLVAMEPALKPWVEEICTYAQCTLAPLRQIEAIVIDSSAFNKVRGDVYRLNFSLKNTSQLALAQPAIELSITDVRDQPIMRRVFSPAEIGPRSGVLPASSEFSTSLTLGIKSGNPSERIAGYRILAFYP